MKKYFLLTVTLALGAALLTPTLTIFAQETRSTFGIESPTKGLTSSGISQSCLNGLNSFMAAGIGYEGFTDYFRDFLLWPSHYADVAAVQQQVNQARYAVVAAFLRCDTNRLKSSTDAYYKLEAELYFVRHFVDTGGGFLKVLSEGNDRDSFLNDMSNFYILRKKSENPDQDKAILAGYFDEFTQKYGEKAKSYASFGNDPAFKDLGAKFDELIKSFKDLSSTSSALKSSNEKEEKPKKAESGDAPAVNGPPKTVKERAAGLFAKILNACVTTPNDRFCIAGSSTTTDPLQTKPGEKKSFGDVIFSIQQQELKQTQDVDKVEMLTRYELLYGDVSGGGVGQVLDRLDKLNSVLGQGIDKVPETGSLLPLEKVSQCATTVLKKQCS